MIDENPQAFLELLNQADGNNANLPAARAGGPGGPSGAGGQGQSIPVSLSTQEQQIIDRVRIYYT
jgi:hypothetical protein